MFHLDAGSKTPLYQQIYAQVKEGILSGLTPEGTKLPSIRALAEEIRAGRNTVESAYAQLVLEGYVTSVPKAGFVVNPVQYPMHPVTNSPLKEQHDSVSGNERCQQEIVYDFHYGNLDASAFPYATWHKIQSEVMKEARKGTSYSEGMHTYGEANGDLALRRELAGYLYRSRGVRCVPEQVVICSGLQPSIIAILRLLKNECEVVALEDPTYTGAKVVYSCFDCPTVAIPVNQDGIDLNILAASSANLVHIAPSHQFPTGAVLPIGKRMEMLAWAESNGSWIIEDDYDSELRYNGRPIPSLQSIDRQGRVIYMGTFSKALSPGIRMSYMVLPAQLAAAFKAVFAGFQCTVPWLEQAVLASFMAEGHWDRHLRKVCLIKKKRRDVFVGTAIRIFGDRIRIHGHNAGLHLLLEVPGGNGENDLVAKAAEYGVRVYPASPFWTDKKRCPKNCLFIGYGMLPERDIIAALERLRQAWPLV
ncbi:MAG: HTH-type transcriptional regulatory protein GabR [Desulfovibrio sp.]